MLCGVQGASLGWWVPLSAGLGWGGLRMEPRKDLPRTRHGICDTRDLHVVVWLVWLQQVGADVVLAPPEQSPAAHVVPSQLPSVVAGQPSYRVFRGPVVCEAEPALPVPCTSADELVCKEC